VKVPARRSVGSPTRLAAVGALAAGLLSACSGAAGSVATTNSGATHSGATHSGASPAVAAPPLTLTGSRPSQAPAPPGLDAAASLLPGMPPLLRRDDVYAADRPGRLSPAVAGIPARVYVPNSGSDTVTVIDPRTYRVLRTVRVGHEPQHVVPSWDLQTLWVNNDLGNSLTPIDPRTGHFGRSVRVDDPYNLYFTPDGRYAVVMASAERQIVFRDAHTMRVVHRLHVDCAGVNHADFSASGRFFLVSCEFSGQLLKVDTVRQRVVSTLQLPVGSKPQDVKIAPDAHVFYVADMDRNGVWLIDGKRLRVQGFVHTGLGAHGLYVRRDSRVVYVTNRDEGSVSLLSTRTDTVLRTWRLPRGGSPDMGGLSADGRVLWLSGRYNGVVYAISTRTGHLLHTIAVGAGPHGLAVYPQPGRYSLGHTGVFR